MNARHSLNQTVVQYAVQQMFKGKSPAIAARNTAQRLNGGTNMFIDSAHEVDIDPVELEEALWENMADYATKSPIKPGDERNVARGTLMYFNQWSWGKPPKTKLEDKLILYMGKPKLLTPNSTIYGRRFDIRRGYLLVPQEMTKGGKIYTVDLEYQVFDAETGEPISDTRRVEGELHGQRLVIGDPHRDTRLFEYQIALQPTSESENYWRGYQAALGDRQWHREGSGKKYYAQTQAWWDGYNQGHRDKKDPSAGYTPNHSAVYNLSQLDDDIDAALEHMSDFEVDLNKGNISVTEPLMIPMRDLGEYDDLSSWLELDSGADEQDVRSFRGPRWAERAERWASPQQMPPIVIVEAPNAVAIADGRGRVNYATAMGWDEIPAVIVTPVHTPNHSAVYYVWLLDYRNAPIDTEGPYGPMSLDRASALARIGATKGDHDRVVSIGRNPEAESFEIVRRYRRDTGERIL